MEVKNYVWKLVLNQINKEMKESIVRESTSRKALVNAQAKLNTDQYCAQREVEIISKMERQLATFLTEYFNSCWQAMMESVDLTIKTEEEGLLHKCRAQLLPLASSITSTALGAAYQALNKGLAASVPNTQTIHMISETPQSSPLLGKDRLDSDTLSNRYNLA
jgi:hypothetical protein